MSGKAMGSSGIEPALLAAWWLPELTLPRVLPSKQNVPSDGTCRQGIPPRSPSRSNREKRKGPPVVFKAVHRSLDRAPLHLMLQGP